MSKNHKIWLYALYSYFYEYFSPQLSDFVLPISMIKQLGNNAF